MVTPVPVLTSVAIFFPSMKNVTMIGFGERLLVTACKFSHSSQSVPLASS